MKNKTKPVAGTNFLIFTRTLLIFIAVFILIYSLIAKEFFTDIEYPLNSYNYLVKQHVIQFDNEKNQKYTIVLPKSVKLKKDDKIIIHFNKKDPVKIKNINVNGKNVINSDHHLIYRVKDNK